MKLKTAFVFIFFLLATNCYTQQQKNYFLNTKKASSFSYHDSTRQPMVGVGYVGNMPGAPVGFSIIVPFKNVNYGFYGEVKMGFSSTEPVGTDYSDRLTQGEIENNFQDEYLGERLDDLIIANVGVLFKSKQAPLYFGIGIGIKSQGIYRQYFDETRIFDPTGKYYIEVANNSGINLNGSLFYTFKNGLYLQGGIDANPAGINIGLGYIFSWYH